MSCYVTFLPSKEGVINGKFCSEDAATVRGSSTRCDSAAPCSGLTEGRHGYAEEERRLQGISNEGEARPSPDKLGP
jgi:hypothetical protein